jgi:hypothetical protein
MVVQISTAASQSPNGWRIIALMTRLVLEIDDAAAQRLAGRAAREGIEPSELAQRLLTEASEIDPFEFVGIMETDAVRGRDVDDVLRDYGFGSR